MAEAAEHFGVAAARTDGATGRAARKNGNSTRSKKSGGKSGSSMPKQPSGETNRYKILIERIFFDHWKKGETEFEFARDEIKEKAGELKIELPDNVGDIVYSFRYRTRSPVDHRHAARRD